MVLKQAEKQTKIENVINWQANELRQNILFCRGLLQEAVLQNSPLNERRAIFQEWLKWKNHLTQILS